MKKKVIMTLLLIFLIFPVFLYNTTFAKDKEKILRVSGPPVADSLAFAIMADKSTITSDKIKIIFIPWNSPDQIRALIASNRIDFAMITTSAGSILYQKGIEIKITAVFKTPLWIVSESGHIAKEMEHLKGTMLFPFGHKEMPEILFNAIMGNCNSSLATRHTGGPLEAVNFLLMRKGEHAFLAEPAATMAVTRSKSTEQKKLPKLVKNLDIREQWAKKFKGKQLYISGLAVFGKTIQHPEIISSVISEYKNTLTWIKKNPEAACKIAQKKFPALAAQAIDNKIPGTDIIIQSDEKAFDHALFCLKRIFEISASLTGGIPPKKDLFMVVK